MHFDETEDTKTDSIIRWISTASNWEPYYLRAIKGHQRLNIVREHIPGPKWKGLFFPTIRRPNSPHLKFPKRCFGGHGLASINSISRRSFSLFKMCKKVSKNSLKSTWIGTQRIHVCWFLMVNVGKYTREWILWGMLNMEILFFSDVFVGIFCDPLPAHHETIRLIGHASGIATTVVLRREMLGMERERHLCQ